VANSGDASIANEGNGAGTSQQITTTSSPGMVSTVLGSESGFEGAMVVATGGSGQASVESYDEVATEVFEGLAQTINVQNGGTFSLSNLGEDNPGSTAGIARMFGGPVSITAGTINITGGFWENAASAVLSDSGDITLSAPNGLINIQAGTGANADAIVATVTQAPNTGNIVLTAPGGTFSVQGGSGIGADATVSSAMGDVTIDGEEGELAGEVNGGLFIIEAQKFGGNPGTVTISTGDSSNPGTLNINGPGTISDPATVVIETGGCSVDGGSCEGSPVFDAPVVTFIDLNNPPPGDTPPEETPGTPPIATENGSSEPAAEPAAETASAEPDLSPEALKVVEEIVAVPTNEVVAQVQTTETILVAASDQSESEGTDGGSGDTNDSDDSDDDGANQGNGNSNKPAEKSEDKPLLMCS